MINNVLFDLDGTLLPMDQDEFVKEYFKRIAAKLAPYGYEPQKLIAAIWKGTELMVKNDGKSTNEEVFWEFFRSEFGQRVNSDKAIFDDFYENDFDNVRSVCGHNEYSAAVVNTLKAKGKRLILATNPIFPKTATYKRVGWAGLKTSDFDLITTYENTGFCKPNLMYYTDILSRMGLKPEETLMVGNDVSEDMVAQKLGMDVFLVTDCLINRGGKDISLFKNGTLEEFASFASDF